MANKKNNVNEIQPIDRKEIVNQTFTDSNALYSAVVARSGESHIEVATDSDGREYFTATYQLANPKGDRKEITITNMEIATRIERVKRAIATGDVAYFITAKELENFTETEAAELGFDNVTQLACAMFPLAKSTVENYRRLSRYFIEDNYELKGAIPKDTPISTLNQLLSLVKTEVDGKADISNVERLFTSGIITPYMKQSEVKARLAKLKDMETEKPLSQLDSTEIEAVKTEIVNDSKERREAKNKEAKEKKNVVTVSDSPQVLSGEALNKISELKAIFEKLGLTYDFTIIEETVNDYVEHNS
ncbi:MAG: hypothetical protein IKY67_13825 [Paludibacteraceae bacterium]|nr:hypothetical protein [Paludibacteraceae bacterium]